MRAHQIMTRSVISVTLGTSIVEAANIMLKRHVSGLTVVEDTGKLVGVVSEGDFIRRSQMRTGRQRGRWLRFILGPGKSASDFVHEHGRKISEVMTASPITITEDTALAEIVYLMERDNVKPAGGSRRQGRRHRVARQSVAGSGQPRPRGAGSDRRR